MKKVLLGDAVKKVKYKDKVPRNKFLQAGKYPVISQEQQPINGYWDDDKSVMSFENPVIVFGDHTKILKFVDFDFVLGADGVKVLNPIDDIDPKYLYYALQSIKLDDLGYARHFRLLKESTISYPESLDEQKRIARKLDEAFEKIDRAKANTEKNLINTQELFESESTRIFSGKNGDWQQASLGDLYIVERGGSPRPIESFLTDKADGVNWIKIGDVKPGARFITATKEKIKPEGVKRSRLVKPGDFVLSNSMSFGRPYIMKISGCIHDGWLLIRAREKDITNGFLYYFLNSKYAYDQFDASAAGSTVRNLNTSLVRKVKIHYPKTNNEQQAIVASLDKLSEQTKKLQELYQRKLDDLEELRQSLLKQAFEGKL